MTDIKQYRTSEPILSELTLGKIINSFMTHDIPIFQKRWNYYSGNQDILKRYTPDPSKPNNKIVNNFIKSIVDNYAGYAVGLPVAYSGDNTEDILQVFKYNDVADEDSRLYKLGLIYGRGIEIAYVDSFGISRFTTLPPTEVIPVYDNTLENNLKYCIRCYVDELYSDDINPTYIVEVYDSTNKTTYRCSSTFTAFELINIEPHYFKQVPFCIFDLNPEVRPACDNALTTLQDAYNSLISDAINDWDAFVDCYLVLKGCTADGDDLASMKQNRCILLDPDSDASFLTKSVQTTEIENLLITTENKIWELSGCVNFSDEKFGNASGIALRYKLLAMENNTSSMLNAFKKALQKRVELVCEILNLVSDSTWINVNIDFTRNLPIDLTENSNVVTQLKGIVSDETLLGLLPFVEDPKLELEKVKKQNEENMELFYGQQVLETSME